MSTYVPLSLSKVFICSFGCIQEYHGGGRLAIERKGPGFPVVDDMTSFHKALPLKGPITLPVAPWTEDTWAFGGNLRSKLHRQSIHKFIPEYSIRVEKLIKIWNPALIPWWSITWDYRKCQPNSYSYVTKASWIHSSFCVLSACTLISQVTQKWSQSSFTWRGTWWKEYERIWKPSNAWTPSCRPQSHCCLPFFSLAKKCQIPGNVCLKLRSKPALTLIWGRLCYL